MRIENLTSERKQNRARVAATVIWENCNRPAQEIYFEAPEEFAGDLTCDPHAFLVGCLMPAMRHGEDRIAIDEEICPELRNGLATAMGWMCHWYGSPRRPVRIESKKRARSPSPRPPERAGVFLSGGIDSLAALRANRLDFPLDHPRSIRDGLLVHGFDIGAIPGADREWETFERALTSLSRVAKDTGITLIPVYTNIRHLDDDVSFWMNEFFGAALSSVAHAFSGRLTTVFIASGLDIPNLQPHGSHPLLDPNYGSAGLEIRHEGTRFSRLDKVRLVADWEVGISGLRVCTMNPPGMFNCGKCDKCIRTMMELLAIGKLAFAPTFPVQDISQDMLEDIRFEAKYDVAFYRELIDPLAALGRLDLVSVIEAKSSEFQKRLIWAEEKDWKGVVKRFDRRYLSSSLFRFYRATRTRMRDVLASGRA